MDSIPAAAGGGAEPTKPKYPAEEALWPTEAPDPQRGDTPVPEEDEERRLSKLPFTMGPVVSNGSSPVVAIDVRSALRGGGRIFWKQHTAAKYATDASKIDDFWSYSRHGNDTARTMMLLLHYNGLQSAAVGILTAVVGACLMPLDWVPDSKFAGILVMLLSTCVAFVLVLTSVIPRRVFLDFACIPQDDEEAKKRGILSLGHTLKCSDRMVLLWDQTYWTRLWCVFECAAYLKLQLNGDASKRMKVLPVPNGRLTWGTFLTISVMILCMKISASFSGQSLPDISLKGAVISVSANTVSVTLSVLCLAYGGLRYVSLLKDQRIQLQNFSLRGSNCFCCAVGHVNPKTGESMGCDRVLIEASVVAWFGCIEAFESYVRDTMHDLVRARSFLPYRYCVMGAMPWFLCSIGEAIWLWRSGDVLSALIYLRLGASGTFVYVPLFTRVVFYSFDIFRPKSAMRSPLFRAVLGCTAFCGSLQLIFSASLYFPYLFVDYVLWAAVSSIFYTGITAILYLCDI